MTLTETRVNLLKKCTSTLLILEMRIYTTIGRCMQYQINQMRKSLNLSQHMKKIG